MKGTLVRQKSSARWTVLLALSAAFLEEEEEMEGKLEYGNLMT